jgi:hypothetical protein
VNAAECSSEEVQRGDFIGKRSELRKNCCCNMI